MRKTIDARYMIERANHFLAETTPLRKDERRAVASFLEILLMDANAYQGYGYLDSAGIQREEGRVVDMVDETRRVYYIHPNL